MKILIKILILFNWFCTFSQTQLPISIVIRYNSCEHSYSFWRYNFGIDSIYRTCDFQNEPFQGYKDTTIVFIDKKIMKKISRRVPKDLKKTKIKNKDYHTNYLTIEVFYEGGTYSINFIDYTYEEMRKVNKVYYELFTEYIEKYPQLECCQFPKPFD